MFVYIKGVKISDRRIKNISRDNCARHENKIISFVKCVKPEDKQMKIPVFLLLLSISMQSTSICAADKKIPKDTLLKIEAKAAIDFPNDHSKQVKVTKSQIKAYEEIKNYKNNNVSAKLLEKIKIIAEQDNPHDFIAQLSKINQLVNSYIKLGRLSTHSFTGGIVKCKKLRWRVAGKGGREMYYWGTLEPESADAIYLIVRSNVGLIGQNFGFPKHDGTWEISIWGDYSMGTTRREEFHCEKY